MYKLRQYNITDQNAEHHTATGNFIDGGPLCTSWTQAQYLELRSTQEPSKVLTVLMSSGTMVFGHQLPCLKVWWNSSAL